MDADPDDQHLRFNALFVTGAVDKMTTYDISRLASIPFTITSNIGAIIVPIYEAKMPISGGK